jgi:hypothetical protein
MSDGRDESDHDANPPPGVSFSISGAWTVGLACGLLGLVYITVGVVFGGVIFNILALCVSAGLVGAAIAMGKRKAGGRYALTALAVVLIPGLPGFASVFIYYVDDLDPIWWPISVAIAVGLVVPAWLPDANRWFSRSSPEDPDLRG